MLGTPSEAIEWVSHFHRRRNEGPHSRADQLLVDKGLLKTKLKEIEARGLSIAALNCSANPLDPGPMGERHRKEIEQTIHLAGEIGVKKIVTMSGLPAAGPGDKVPNWLVYTKSWPAADGRDLRPGQPPAQGRAL
jgi:sugar phosphate isomerase/epimerase